MNDDMERYIQHFINVCKKIFNELLKVELREERPYFIKSTAVSKWDVSAIIGLTGEAVGAVSISMSDDLASKLTEILTRSPHYGLDEDVVDAIGEIVNIIAGNVKKNLEEDFHLVISLPAIVKGKNHTIRWPGNQTRIICVPFRIFDNAIFCLSVAIEAVSGKED